MYLYEMNSQIFSKQSGLYAKYRPRYPDTLYEFLMRYVSDNMRACDCGTGTGIFAEKLTEYFQRVYAIDVSVKQLSNAVERDNLCYSLSPAETIPFNDAFFDLVTVAQALHWFDTELFFKEVKRVLRPNGLIAVIWYGRVKVEDNEARKQIDRFYELMFSNFFASNRKLLDHGYRDIDFPFNEIVCPEFKSVYTWSLDDLRGYFYSWSAVQRYIDNCHKDPTEEIIASLASFWQKKEKVSFPMYMRLGRL